jgi:hypothetical protein
MFFKDKIKAKLLKLRLKLIDKLIGKDITVIANAKTYDIVLKANYKRLHLIRDNEVVSLEKVLRVEREEAVEFHKHGVQRQGNAIVLVRPWGGL